MRRTQRLLAQFVSLKVLGIIGAMFLLAKSALCPISFDNIRFSVGIKFSFEFITLKDARFNHLLPINSL